MSKKYKMLRLLATTSIIATNVFPVTPQLPQIVVQAATSQEEQETSATEESNTSTERPKEETSTSQSEDTPSSSEEQPLQKSDAKDSKNQEADSSKEPIVSGARIINGTWGTSAYTFDESTGTMTVYAGTLGENEQQPWSKGEVSPDQIKKIELVGDVVAPADSDCLFSATKLKDRLFNLNEITGLENLDTSYVTKMYSMFAHCSSLKKIDVSNFDTSNVTEMFAMFHSCSSLQSLDISSFNTSQVTSMKEMFYGCSSLQSLDVSSFNTSQVTDMTDMFNGCYGLQSLDVSSFSTSQVTNMAGMFQNCSGLNELTLGEKSIFNDTVNLPDSGWMGKNTHVVYGASTDFINNYDGSHPDTFIRTELWGTSPYTFDESTGTMTVYSGNLDGNGQQPWVKGEVSAEKIQKIELVGNVVAPEDSRRLFSADAEENRLSNLKEINGLTNLDTSNVTIMYDFFSGCSSLQSLDLSNFDTSQVTDMGAMFYQCNSLQKLDLSNFNTKQVTSMYSMFYGCSNLQNINMSSFDTSQVTNMYTMFTKCTSLKILDLSSFDTSKLTTMSYMFSGCSSLQSIDLSSFDTSQVMDMEFMFKDCTNLNELTLGKKSIFNDTVDLRDGTWLGKNTGVSYATSSEFITNYDGSQPDTFIRTNNMLRWGTSPYTFDESTGTMTIYSGTLGTYEDSPWTKNVIAYNSIQKIELFGKVVAPKDSQFLFSSIYGFLQNLKEINGLEKLDTSQVTDMSTMFYQCSSLQNLDLSSFNTSQVTTMSEMFKGCSDLQTLDLSSFDTSQVMAMFDMFYGCTSLQSLDLSSFNTSKVMNMDIMFYKCVKLQHLDVSSFDTSQVTTMASMFYGCSGLQSLDLSSFNTSQVTTMFNMFGGCSGLQSLDLSNFDTSKLTSMLLMFDGCSSLNELTLGEKSIFDDTVELQAGSWLGKNTGVRYATSADFMNNYDGSQPDTFVRTETKYWGTSPYTFDETTGTMTVYSGNLDGDGQQPWVKGEVSAEKIQKIELVGNVVAPEDSRRLFSADAEENRLSNLKEINGLTNLDTSNVTIMYDFFSGCSSLQSLDLSSFDTSQVTNMMSMFYKCSSLQSLDLSSFDTSQVTNMKYMFYKCSSLQSVDLSNFNTSQVTNMKYMFFGCSSLQSVDLSSFDTSQVTDMSWMFGYCSNLQSVDVSNFDTSQVTNMYAVFGYCSSLQSVDLSSFDTSQVTTMAGMLTETRKLNELTLGEKSIFDDTVKLQAGSWLGKNTGVRYATSADFMNNYDGSQPDTFVRTETKYWGTSPY
ncbi:BspA family leucine-rich repeat surface protein, partial [Enterococcus faecium]|nr:BspA family leucine-rich repeat surface protein [Enterococcus faecium]